MNRQEILLDKNFQLSTLEIYKRATKFKQNIFWLESQKMGRNF